MPRTVTFSREMTPAGIAGQTCENGRAGEIRTHDLLHPMQARYQATLRPETRERSQSGMRAVVASGIFPAESGQGLACRARRDRDFGGLLWLPGVQFTFGSGRSPSRRRSSLLPGEAR